MAFITASAPALAVDLPDPDRVELAWSPAVGNVAGYIVYGSVNGEAPLAIGFSPLPQIQITDLGLSVGDTLVVHVQAFGPALDRGPFSPPSDTIFFRTSPGWSNVPDQHLTEGDSVSVPLAASIASGAQLKLSSPDLPPFARIDDFGDNTGRLVLDPGPGDAGFYDIRLNATDLGPPVVRTTKTIYVHVAGYIPSPTMVDIDDQSTAEGQTLQVDIDADKPVVVTGRSLPSFVSIVNTAGSARLIATPGYDDAGSYAITLDARDLDDSSMVTTALFMLTVNDTNRPPVLTAPAQVSVANGSPVDLDLSAVDPDGDQLLFIADVGGVVAASRHYSVSNTARLQIPASFTQAGDFTVQVLAIDSGSPAAHASASVAVSVVAAPPAGAVAPVLAPLADVQVEEGGGATIVVQVSNAAQGSFSLSAAGLPPFASFSDLGNGSAELTLAPAWGDRGSFDVALTAVNDVASVLSATQTLAVDVAATRIAASHHGRNEIVVFDPATGSETRIGGSLFPIALAQGDDGRIFSLRGIGHPYPPAVLAVDPDSLQVTTLTAGGLLDATLHGPTSLTVGDDGLIYVSVVQAAPTGTAGHIISVDPDSGQQTTVFTIAPPSFPISLAATPDGKLYVGDASAHGVIEVDLQTGVGQKIASLPIPHAIALHESGRLVVANGAGDPGTGSLWWLDPADGDLELLSEFGQLGSVASIAVQPGGDITVVDERATGMTRVDPQTGQQSGWVLPGAGHGGMVIITGP